MNTDKTQAEEPKDHFLAVKKPLETDGRGRAVWGVSPRQELPPAAPGRLLVEPRYLKMMQSRGPGAGRPGGQARARAWVPRPGACRLCPRRLRLQPSQEAVCPPRQGPGRFPKESPAQVTQGQRPVLRPLRSPCRFISRRIYARDARLGDRGFCPAPGIWAGTAQRTGL